MATQPIAKAEQFESAEFQCAMTHIRYGRCARSARLEEHHIIPLGVSGKRRGKTGQGPTTMICTTHHNQIHHRGPPDDPRYPWLWRVTLEDSTYGYCKRKRGKPDYVLWDNVGDAWEQEAVQADQQFDSAREQVWHHYWLIGEAIHHLWTGNKFHLLGSGIDADNPDDALRQYAAQKGIGHRSLKDLHSSYIDLKKLPRDIQARFLRQPYRLMRDAGPSIRKLAAERRYDDIEQIVEHAETVGRTHEAIVLAREMVRPPTEQPRTVHVGGNITIVRIDADVEVGADCINSETGRRPVEHVVSRILGWKWVTGIDDHDLRIESRAKTRKS